MNENLLPAFQRIFDVVAELREKCPWDREQTKESLRHLTIEETYELSDAVLRDDWNDMKVEIGDLLLHVLFYSRIAEEQNEFDTQQMMESLTDKLIRRHPHIYGDVEANDSDTVIKNWEEIKMREKAKGKKKVLDGVPNSMPSLIQAMRIQEKVSNVGFDWEEPEDVWNKVKEELNEFETAGREGNQEEMEKEFGDLLFSLINHARFLKINPEDALAKTNLKFKNRFEYLEEKVQTDGRSLKEMSLAEMDEIWEEAKLEEG